MVQRIATFRNRRYNSYVPAAAYSVDISNEGPYQVDFGTPAAASATFFLNAQSTTVAGTAQGLAGTAPFLMDMVVEPFGRNITAVASVANATVLTVRGRDYLGQPMAEQMTLNGTTPVVSVKAFKWLDSVTWAATTGTINVGVGARLGLPYRMNGAISTAAEEVNGVLGATGTFTAGNTTDPQTFTSTDPRGLYTPTGTLNGTNRIRATFLPNNLLNANGNGGLYGLPHFYG